MAKVRRANRKGRSEGGGKFLQLFAFEINSPAYRSLSPVARAIYAEMKLLFNGENNGGLFLSVRRAAERAGVSQNTAKKGLHELQERGFIIPNVKGSFHLKQRHATTWILTIEAYGGRLATKDFMRWRPEDKKQNAVSNFEQSVSVFDAVRGV